MGLNRPYQALSELPAEIPVFPLGGCLLLPRCDLPLNIFEPRYVAMIDAALAGDRIVGMIQPRPEDANAEQPRLFDVGCAGRMTRFAETGDGRYMIFLTGICPFRIDHETTANEPFRRCAVSFDSFEFDLVTPPARTIDRTPVQNALGAYAKRHSFKVDWDAVASSTDEALINELSMLSPFAPQEKQALLEAPDIGARARILVAIAEMELATRADGRSPLH